MATVTGTAGDDFIHVLGDGLTPPPGTNEVSTATNGNDVITSGAGTDIIYAGGGNDQIRITAASDISGLAEFIDGGEGDFDSLSLACSGTVDLTQATILSVYRVSGANITPTPLNVIMTADQLSAMQIFNANFFLDEQASLTLTQSAFSGVNLTGSVGDDLLELRQTGSSKVGFSINGAGGNDTILATMQQASVILTGGDGKDTITAGKKGDILDGGDGADVLNGGRGSDSLTGGKGADDFAYRSVSDSAGGKIDTISDFTHSQGDLIDLRKIDADTTVAKDQAFHLGGAVFTHVAGELIQTVSGGQTLLQGDTNGDGNADFAIQLAGGPVLVDSDFIF